MATTARNTVMATMPADDIQQAYRDAIVRRVCSVCLDQRTDGSCGLRGRTCTLESHLPAIVFAVSSIESDRMDEYEAAVRAQICTTCAQAAADGGCAVRDRGECALAMYISLVVDAIEEVRQGR